MTGGRGEIPGLPPPPPLGADLEIEERGGTESGDWWVCI